MNLDAEFAKRSEMRIYTHFALPDGVRGYVSDGFVRSHRRSMPVLHGWGCGKMVQNGRKPPNSKAMRVITNCTCVRE